MTKFSFQTPASSSTPDSSTPDSRASTFQAVEGGPESKNGTTLMVEAYAIIWTVLMVWLLTLWRKQNNINQRIDDLEHAIDVAAAKAEKKKAA